MLLRPVLLTCAALCWLLTTHLSHALPPSEWKKSPYAYDAKNTTLLKVLQDFAVSHGVSLKLSSQKLGKIKLQNERIKAPTSIDFLNRIASRYQLSWFVFSSKLYVNANSKNDVARIQVGTSSLEEVRLALSSMGLLDPKFGWGELPEQGIILVNGPPTYLKLIRDLVKKPKKESPDYQAMIFRIKHALVTDQEVEVRGKTIIRPGIATLLQNLLNAKKSGNSTAQIGNIGLPSRDQISAGIFNKDGSDLQVGGISMPSPRVSAANTLFESNPGNLSVGGRDKKKVMVESDPRTNSIIIYDSPEKRPYYEHLIRSLDVPQRLLEIEALVVEFDRDDLPVIQEAAYRSHSPSSSYTPLTKTAAHASNASARKTLTPGEITSVARDPHFHAILKRLEDVGRANVIARHRVVTPENFGAVLDFSETIYIEQNQNNSAINPAQYYQPNANMMGAGMFPANMMTPYSSATSKTPVTAGSLLRVTPRVIEQNGEESIISLLIDMEDGHLIERRGQDTPSLHKSSLNTQAMVGAGRAIVLGGARIPELSRKTAQAQSVSANNRPVRGWINSASDRQQHAATSPATDHTQQPERRERAIIIIPRLLNTGYHISHSSNSD